MTLRNNTERPETVTMGTNALIGTDPKAIAPAMDLLFENKWKSGTVPPLWDGRTAERLVQILIHLN
jgi:UDP-N-acetylglucosamine 2-epimerase (non-hydrolysing)